jgi:hypothetical protein
MSRTITFAMVLAFAAAQMACKKSPHIDGTPHTDEVVAKWKKADLNPTEFKDVDPAAFRAGYCQAGTVSGVDTLVCEYKDDDSLDRGKQGLQGQWAKDGVGTAVAIRSGRTLLGVADRRHADPNGKAIKKLVDVFKQL